MEKTSKNRLQNRYQELMASAENGQLSHALLFHGPQGNAGLNLALQLTQLILCQNPAQGQACKVCGSCVKQAKFIHPDVHYVFPVIAQNQKDHYKDWYPEWRSALTENPFMGYYQWISSLKGENKQGNISVKSCNELIYDLSLKAYLGGKKIGIIWMAEYLGKEGNRLLKLIEEPPENTFLFLITSDMERILPTIISRCSQIFIPPFRDGELAELLMERKSVDQELAKRIAMLAQGDWNQAISLLAEGDTHALDLLKRWIKAGWSGNMAVLNHITEDLQALSREEQKQFMLYCLQFFQKLVWRLAGLKSENEYDEEAVVLDFLVTKMALPHLEELRIMMEENLASMHFNPNQRIMWMQAGLRLKHILHQKEHAGSAKNKVHG